MTKNIKLFKVDLNFVVDFGSTASTFVNVFIIHGYLPADFIWTAIFLITKNKTGDISDKNNYIDLLHLLLQHLSYV